MSIPFDINSEKWLSLWKLNKLMPDYHETLRKYFINLAASLQHYELIKELETLIKKKIEEPMGASWAQILYVYKNLPYLNSMTKSKNPEYPHEYVMKYEMRDWLESIEQWIYTKLIELEPEIRFRERQTIM
jgi:hypothetical protein